MFHAGWIAAAGAMASTKENEIPIVVLFPEVKFRQAKFLKAEFRFQSKLTDENCIIIEHSTMKEVREEIKKEYAEELGISK